MRMNQRIQIRPLFLFGAAMFMDTPRPKLGTQAASACLTGRGRASPWPRQIRRIK